MAVARFSLSFSEELASVIDEIAEMRGEDRSRLVETLLRENELVQSAIKIKRKGWLEGLVAPEEDREVKDEELKQSPARRSREVILKVIETNPGISKSELRRQTGFAWGTICHHLHLLQEANSIKECKSGKHTRLFRSDLDEQAMKKSILAQSGATSKILYFMAENPDADENQISKELRLSRRVIRDNLDDMFRAGILKRSDSPNPKAPHRKGFSNASL